MTRESSELEGEQRTNLYVGWQVPTESRRLGAEVNMRVQGEGRGKEKNKIFQRKWTLPTSCTSAGFYAFIHSLCVYVSVCSLYFAANRIRRLPCRPRF